MGAVGGSSLWTARFIASDTELQNYNLSKALCGDHKSLMDTIKLSLYPPHTLTHTSLLYIYTYIIYPH